MNTEVRSFITADRERLATPELLSFESIKYAADGKRQNSVFVFMGARSVYRYDSAGHQIESVTNEADGRFRDREISVFDGAGRLISTLLEAL